MGAVQLDRLEGHHYQLELDAGHNRKPVEVTEEGGHMGNLGAVFVICCKGLVTEAGNTAKTELH